MGNRIVLTTYGSLGDLHPYLAIALELKDQGHQPVIATHELYAPKLKQKALNFTLLDLICILASLSKLKKL
jgi:UDP:flavonoid glycosyltransferase YjiC (YdhE family)